MEELSNNKFNYDKSLKTQSNEYFLVEKMIFPNKTKKNKSAIIFKTVLKNPFIIFIIFIIPIILITYKIIKKEKKNDYNKYAHILKRITIKNETIHKIDNNDIIIIDKDITNSKNIQNTNSKNWTNNKPIDKIIINNNTNPKIDKILDLKYLTNYIPINKNEEVKKGKIFFELCLNKELLNKSKIVKHENPLISVVIPLYNTEEKLWASVRSVQNQNITNFEIVLVNDASNNKTCEVIKKMLEEDPRILLIFSNNIFSLMNLTI